MPERKAALTASGNGIYSRQGAHGVEIVTINLAEGLVESGICRTYAVPIECDCADTPPTMPTCRSEHLATCPVRGALDG